MYEAHYEPTDQDLKDYAENCQLTSYPADLDHIGETWVGYQDEESDWYEDEAPEFEEDELPFAEDAYNYYSDEAHGYSEDW